VVCISPFEKITQIRFQYGFLSPTDAEYSNI
jgi:hypothetical protein